MHGSEAAVLVPQEVTSLNVTTPCAGELRVGRPAVAVEREVVGTRGLADDQQQQRRLRAGGTRQNLHVGADRLRRPARPCAALAGQRAEGIERVDRVDQVAHRLVVAHRRRQVGEQREHQRDQHHDRDYDRPRVPAELPQRAQALHAHPPHHHERQPGEEQHADEEAQAEQVARLARVGLQHVGHHRRVDDDAVRAHEVRAERRRDDEHGDHRLDRVPPREQRHQGHQAAPRPSRRTRR